MEIVQLVGSLLAAFLVAYLAMRLFPAQNKLEPHRVKRNIKRYCPDLPSEVVEGANIILSETGASGIAILPAKHGVALLKQMGDRVTVRHFANTADISIKKSEGYLHIDMNDFTLPSLTLELNDEQSDTVMAIGEDTTRTAHA